MLGEKSVDSFDVLTRAGGDSLFAGRIDYLGFLALLRCHGLNYRTNSVELTLVNINVLDLLLNTRDK